MGRNCLYVAAPPVRLRAGGAFWRHDTLTRARDKRQDAATAQGRAQRVRGSWAEDPNGSGGPRQGGGGFWGYASESVKHKRKRPDPVKDQGTRFPAASEPVTS